MLAGYNGQYAEEWTAAVKCTLSDRRCTEKHGLGVSNGNKHSEIWKCKIYQGLKDGDRKYSLKVKETHTSEANDIFTTTVSMSSKMHLPDEIL